MNDLAVYLDEKRIIPSSLLKSQTIFYQNKEYNLEGIQVFDNAPEWLTNYAMDGPAKHMDQIFKLVTSSTSLEYDYDMATSLGDQGSRYMNIILEFKDGNKAVIKDAYILDCFRGTVTLVGGVFVLMDQPKLLGG